MYIESDLFRLPDVGNAEQTPAGMARRFGVPYLGKLPMDPNMMRACEEGKSFLELFPESAASASFREVVNKVVNITSQL